VAKRILSANAVSKIANGNGQTDVTNQQLRALVFIGER